MKRKIVFVLKRYGEEISGGSEFYTKALAEQLTALYDVEVLTTTAMDLMYYDPYYSPGVENINGVTVHRFHCARRNRDVLDPLSRQVSEQIADGNINSPQQEEIWAQANGPFSPELFHYLQDHQKEYTAIFAVCYIDYTTIQTIKLFPDKTVLIPTAHDEIWIRLGIFQEVFHRPRYLAFLTQEEHDFIRSYFRNSHIPSSVIGCGINIPNAPDTEHFRNKFTIQGKYLAYVGRIDVSKGCDFLIESFIRYKQEYPGSLKLVLMGKSTLSIPEHPDIIQTGFISEQEKFDGLAGAIAQVAPSQYESLCIALLEGLSVGTPCLVNGNCKVLQSHCQKSNAGFCYYDYDSFKSKINELLSDSCDYQKLSQNSQSYISKNYTWDVVIQNFSQIIDHVSNPAYIKNFDINNHIYFNRNIMRDAQSPSNLILYNDKTPILPMFEKNEIAICFSSSDYFAPIMSVALASLVKNTSLFYNYDIIILITDMSYDNMHLLNRIVAHKPNIHLRFINVQKAIDDYRLSLSNHYTKFTFYRLLIPKMMQAFEKILYLDSDLVVNHDVAELYQTDIQDYLLAATRDLTVYCWMLLEKKAVFRRYMDEYCGLTVPGSYMQGGVSLYNIKKFNEELPSEVLMQKASERSYQNCDQDLMNILCFGKIKFISQRWNMLVMHMNNITLYNTVLPQDMFDAYIDARNTPYIIHYSGQLLPCFVSNVDKFEYFWLYARETPYYEVLISMVEKRPSQPQPSTSINLMAQFEPSHPSVPSETIDTAQLAETKYTFSHKSFLQKIFPKEKMKDLRRQFFRIYAHRHLDNYMDRLSKNEYVSIFGNILILHPGGILNGPCSFMRRGRRHLFIDMKKGIAQLDITESNQSQIIKSVQLKNGKNYISFKLREDVPDIEFVITNLTQNDISIKRIYYC